MKKSLVTAVSSACVLVVGRLGWVRVRVGVGGERWISEWLGGAPAVPAWAESLGWMGREAGTHSLAAAFSPGAFAHVAVGGHGGACLGDDVHAATAQAMACLEAAGLAAEDVSLARVFVRADGLEAAGAAFPAMLHAAWCGAGFEEPVPVVVPVLAVGLGPAAGEPVVFEVTAGRGG